MLNPSSICTGFGVYQEYYMTHQLSSYSPSDISWIGSVQVAMMFWGGTMCGQLFDRGYFRHLLTLGSILTIVGVMTTSLATKYWQIILAQGLCLGMGLGIIFTVAIGCVSHFFAKKRGMANGLVASGSSFGGIVFPIMLNKLINKPGVGFAQAVRATVGLLPRLCLCGELIELQGYILIGLLLVANILLRTRLPPKKSGGPIVDFSLFKDTNYTFYTLGVSFVLLGLYFPVFYLQAYSIEKGVDPNLAFYTLAILSKQLSSLSKHKS
jgi:MFS family permease